MSSDQGSPCQHALRRGSDSDVEPDDDDDEIGTLVERFYRAFDNRGGQIPALADLHDMFAAEAKILHLSPAGVQCWNVDDFITPRLRLLTDGSLVEFAEWEVANQTFRSGETACRWSYFEKRGELDGSEMRGGGLKLIHLVRSKGRWLIEAILWQDCAH